LSYSIVSSDVSAILAWSISEIGLKIHRSAAEKMFEACQICKSLCIEKDIVIVDFNPN
jgi:hypothetical protein